MDILRKCKKCEIEKPLSDFRSHKTSRDGKSIICKRCLNRQCRKLREAKIKAGNAAVREAKGQRLVLNKSEIEELRKNAIEEFIKNKPKKNVKRSPQWKRATSLRSQLRLLVRGLAEYDSLKELVGCDHETLKVHLESLFQEGMSWENYGKHGWHVDHIKPCIAFDLTNKAQAMQCFHFTNLQPLWASENWSKGFKFTE